MSKYSLRRVLSFLLAVMMVCTLLPTAAFAAEGVEQPTAGEQTAATPDGEENQKPETPAVEEEKGEKTPEEPKQDVASVQSADGLNTEISTQALDTGHTLKVRFQVLYLDDTLYTGYRYGTAESTTFVCQYKTPHSDTGSTNHTIAISDIESAAGHADVESGYTISGWTKTASANPQVWPFTVKEPTGCMSGQTIYLVAKKSNPTAPSLPGESAIGGLLNPVILSCDKKGHTQSYTVSALPEACTASDLRKDSDSGKYVCTLTIDGTQFLAHYNSDHTPTHTLSGDTSKTLTLTYDASTKEWAAPNAGVYFNIRCGEEQPQKPNTPTKEQITSALDNPAVILHCTRQNQDSSYQFGYVPNTKYDVTEPKLENGSYTCTLTIYADGYVSWINQAIPHLNHTLSDDESKTVKLTYDSAGKRWTASPRSVTFNVSCVEPKPAEPSDDFLLKLPIGIGCINKSRTHRHATNEIKLIPGSYKVNPVQKDDVGYYCTVTVTAKDYVDKFSEDEKVPHTLASGEKESKEFLLRWAGAWYPPNGTAVFDVVCETLYSYRIQRSYFTGDRCDGSTTEDITGIRSGTTVYVKDLEKVTTFNGGSYEYEGCSRSAGIGVTLTTEGDPGITITSGDGAFFVQTYTRTAPQAPDTPSEDKIKELLGDNAVVIGCSVNGAHAEKAYALLDGSFTPGEVVDDGNGSYHCDVTVSAAPYVTEYSKDNGTHKLAGTEPDSKTVRLAYNSTGGWHIPQSSSVPLRFYVQCETVYYSYKVVHVYFTNGEEDGRTDPATYPSVASGTVVSADKITKAPTYNGNTYEYTSADPEEAAVDNNNVVFILRYDRAVEMCTVTYTDGVDGKVFPDQEYTVAMGEATPAFNGVPTREGYKFTGWNPAVSATVTETTVYTATWEPEAPKKPTDEEVTKLQPTVAIKCTTGHGDLTWTLCDGTFTVGNVEGDAANGYTCTVTVEAKNYVEWFNSNKKANGVTHTLTSPDKATFELKYVDGKWTKPTNPVVKFEVKCEVYTVTYTDGVDGEEVFADQVYNVEVGKPTPDFNGTPTRDGYKFTGWNPAVSATVTGNATYTATWELDAPKAPTKEEVEKLFDSEKFIRVECSFRDTHTGWVACELKEGKYGIGSVTKKGDDYYCTIELDAASYADQYNAISYAGSHRLSPEDQKHTLTLKFDRESETWTAVDARTIVITVSCARTVTYTDGVDGEEIFPNETTEVAYGKATPAFTGGTPTRKDYVFAGWTPAVADKVTEDVTYTATWKEDFNNNGKPDDEEERFTVTYTDGVKGKAFKDQVYENLLSGTDTPEFSGKPTRKGYTFAGWSPKVTDTVTKNVTYTATWKAVNTSGKDKLAKTGDNGLVLVFGGLMLLSLCGAAAVCIVDRKRRHV